MRDSVIGAVVIVLLTACPYGGPHRDESQNAPAKTTTTTSNPRAGADRSSTANAVVDPNRDIPGKRPGAIAEPEMNVELTEYAIHMPQTLAAGTQHFKIVNSGKENHNFAITGNGVEDKLPDNLSRGNTTDIKVDLKPGTYTVYCPVDGHRGKGMQTTITVK